MQVRASFETCMELRPVWPQTCTDLHRLATDPWKAVFGSTGAWISGFFERAHSQVLGRWETVMESVRVTTLIVTKWLQRGFYNPRKVRAKCKSYKKGLSCNLQPGRPGKIHCATVVCESKFIFFCGNSCKSSAKLSQLLRQTNLRRQQQLPAVKFETSNTMRNPNFENKDLCFNLLCEVLLIVTRVNRWRSENTADVTLTLQTLSIQSHKVTTRFCSNNGNAKHSHCFW